MTEEDFEVSLTVEVSSTVCLDISQTDPSFKGISCQFPNSKYLLEGHPTQNGRFILQDLCITLKESGEAGWWFNIPDCQMEKGQYQVPFLRALTYAPQREITQLGVYPKYIPEFIVEHKKNVAQLLAENLIQVKELWV